MTFAEALTETLISAAADGGAVVVIHLGLEDSKAHVDAVDCPCGPVAIRVGPAVELDEATYEGAFRMVPTPEPDLEANVRE